MRRGWVVLFLLLSVYPAISETMHMTGTIQEVKARHQDHLMTLPRVISVGIGKDEQGNPAIIVGLDGKQQPATQIPERLDGYPVVIRDTGTVRAQ